MRFRLRALKLKIRRQVADGRLNVAGNSQRRGAKRTSNKKGAHVGTGGHGRKKLKGKGPTPKAEDRPYHPASKRKSTESKRSTGARSRSAASSTADVIAGRNSVVEALRYGIPAKSVFVAWHIDLDDRIREIFDLATKRKIDVHEVQRVELDRLTGGAVHQGIALRVPAYEYYDAQELLEHDKPLIVVLDGVTDPRNLGAILRSAAAFGAHGVVVPERRSVGMTASAWKASAGAAARVPVAQVTNVVRFLQQSAKAGCMVVGLDAGGDVDLPRFELGDGPLVLVVGSEGKGLSRLVRETCDQVLSIPMAQAIESLNAGVATSIALYAIAQARA